MFLQLRKDWPGNFRRTVRDSEGKASHIIEWSPGDIIEMKDEHERAATKDDIGKALVEKSAPIAKAEPVPPPEPPPAVPKRKK
jgi:hypothetical protein